MNGLPLTKTNSIKYLGIEIESQLNFNLSAINKFKNVQKSIFSLNFLGLKPLGVCPMLQSFLYKTYCLSQFTYALETSTLNKKTRQYLNIAQNNLLRQFVGLKYYCRISKILNILKILNFEKLYLKSKLSFIKSIKYNELSCIIFNQLL